jgi:glycosyltransferase involved in cell wall biosynthesis
LNSPLISVILPVFNAEATIVRSIKSILDQTFLDFELIIVNNGSTDQTKNIILGFKDSRICHLELPTPNLVAALNFGIEQAKGAFIARIDSDDYAYPTRLEIQIAHLQQNPPTGLVSGKVNYVGDSKKNEGYFRYVDWANSILSTEETYLLTQR